MKKYLVISALMLLCGFSLSAQTNWFSTKIGQKLTYGSYDRNGAMTSATVYEVKDITSEDGKVTVAFETTVFDKDMKPSGVSFPGKVWSADGYFHVDARSSLGELGKYDGIKGHAPIIPENPKNGEMADDCKVTIEEAMTEFQWTDIKITTGQSVTTAAGTFNNAILLEYKTNSKVAFIKVQSVCKEWYVKGIGRVRSETYNNKGVLGAWIDLLSIED